MIERRVIVAPRDQERVAVLTVAIPAGGEIEIDPTWRFLGWRNDLKIKVKREPNRIEVRESDAAD